MNKNKKESERPEEKALAKINHDSLVVQKRKF